MKILIFGQVAVACFKKDEEGEYNCFDVSSSSVLSRGKISGLTDGDAMKFCPLHPRFMKYYEYGMMPLWKGKGIFTSGTECPTSAVKSYFPEGTKYYIAWNPLAK